MSSGSCGPSRWTRYTNVSRLPFGPGSPESTTPAVAPPHATAASTISRTTRRRTPMARTTPFGAARDVRRGLREIELDVLRELDPRLVVPTNAAGEHERLRLSATFGETALDEQNVEPFLHAALRSSSDATRRSAIASNNGEGT